MTEAVATSDTLVKPVQVAPFPFPPPDVGDALLVMTVPELVVDAPVPVAVVVAVAVTLAGTVPDIIEPEPLAVPTSATGEAQSHTEGVCKSVSSYIDP